MYDHRPLLKFAISAPSLIEINLPLFLHTFPFYSSKNIKKERPAIQSVPIISNYS